MGFTDKEMSRRTFVVGSVGVASALASVWGAWPWLPGMFHRRGTYTYPMRTELWKGESMFATASASSAAVTAVWKPASSMAC